MPPPGADEFAQFKRSVPASTSGRTFITSSDGLAGVAKPANPITADLNDPSSPRYAGDMPGSFEGHPENLAGYMETGPGEIAGGTADVARGNIKHGLNRVFSGVGTTALPAAPFLAAGAPIAAARAVAGGYLGGKIGEAGTELAGGDEEAQQLGGNIGNLIGGYGGAEAPNIAKSKVFQSLKAISKPPLKMALETAKDTPILGGAIRGAAAFKDVPGQLRDIWAKPSAEVEAGPEIAPAPYRMSGEQIQDPVTVTPRRVFQPKGLLTEGTPDVPAPAEPSPAPYRMKGNQIPDATTVTPRRTFQPAGLLTDGSAPAAPAAKAFQLPAQTDEPATGRNFDLPRTNSGEGVLTQALTALDNKTLLKVARSRGINVAQETNLKPGVGNQRIINKIIDDFSPDELDEVRNQGIEASRNKPVPAEGITPEQGQEAWHYKVLNTFFPDVAVPKAMAARAQSVIANRPSVGLREFSQPSAPNPITDAISQATGNGQPVLPPETSEGRTFSPNASGESSASLEAINRQASERVNGVKRFRIDTRSGKETPLIGVDAVDAKAGPYDRIVQRGPQGETTLDQGLKARPSPATPKVANNDNLEDVLKRATQGLKTFGAEQQNPLSVSNTAPEVAGWKSITQDRISSGKIPNRPLRTSEMKGYLSIPESVSPKEVEAAGFIKRNARGEWEVQSRSFGAAGGGDD